MNHDFRHNVETLIPALRRYARALTRDTDLADDLVQDTLVRALRSEKLFVGGDLRAWLYTILTNLNRNRRRSLARQPTMTELYDTTADASGTEAEGRDISRALATLPASLREAFVMKHVEGRSYEEMADLLGTTVGALKMRVHRAREALQALLEEKYA